MRTPMISDRLADELRSADLVAAGLLYVFYPAPSKIVIDAPAAVVFAGTGSAPAWGEQVWQREHRVRLLVPSRGFLAAEINAIEPIIEPIWDHFTPRSMAAQLRVADAEGSVQHCYPSRYEASLAVDYAGDSFTTIDVFFDILNQRFAGDP